MHYSRLTIQDVGGHCADCYGAPDVMEAAFVEWRTWFRTGEATRDESALLEIDAVCNSPGREETHFAIPMQAIRSMSLLRML